MSTILDLGSTKILEEIVKIDGVEFVLREASGGAVVAYRNSTISKARMKDGKVVGLDGGVADAEPLLVSKCLFQKDDAGVTPVPLHQITKWPSRIQGQLFKKIKEMSKLDVPETPEQIRKQIEELQAQLDELEGDDPKAESAT